VLCLTESLSGHGHLHLPGLNVVRSFDWLRFSRHFSPPAPYCASVPIPGQFSHPASGLRLSLELIEKRETSVVLDCVYNSGVGCLDRARLSGVLHCRNWQPGDRYQPFAASGVQKIKTLFQRARIPLWERRIWPVLLDGGSIVWTRRFGVAAQFAAGPEAAAVLKIREL
jgi:tRNA(Ile)-lysidine synthase